MAFRTDPGLKLPYQDNSTNRVFAARRAKPYSPRLDTSTRCAIARCMKRARKTSQGFGRFVRSMVGLERAAVREAFGEFLAAGVATAAQIEFINMVIEHLTDQGVMDPALLYEPPFTDVAPTGPDQLFDEEKVARLFIKIQAINDSAVA